MPDLTPTVVWRATPELVLALASRFGDPDDAYVNGSQVWLREDGPDGMTIEWRLHPTAGYVRPNGMTTYNVFTRTADALAMKYEPPPDVTTLWDGLEAFPAYGDEIEPAVLGWHATEAFGIAPDASGLVDHELIGLTWEQEGGRRSIVADLLAQLEPSGSQPHHPDQPDQPHHPDQPENPDPTEP